MAKVPGSVQLADGRGALKLIPHLRLERVDVTSNDGCSSRHPRSLLPRRDPASLGTVKMRSIFRLLQRAYLDIEMLSGIRVSGARRNKPRQLAFSLRSLARFNIAKLEQTTTTDGAPFARAGAVGIHSEHHGRLR
ncbi:hypothetical protein ABIF20_003081 [Bradyrhizobium japonicum]|uniref:hypothetical protein n=1 Tax=Bradyrhizobium japonicum TaxID=375 RepID=UPI003838936F